MQRSDRAGRLPLWAALLLLVAQSVMAEPASSSASSSASTTTHRWRAPIAVLTPGVFVQLPLPASAYAHARQPGLADLRIVDAAGQRVPYAWLSAAVPQQPSPVLRPAKLYALPPLPSVAGSSGPSTTVPPQSPWTLTLQGDRLQIQANPPTRGAAPSAPVAASAPPLGWLIDLGAPVPGAAAARALRLAWSGPAEFSAPYTLAVSADLREWRDAGGGQLMALAPLAQDVSQSLPSATPVTAMTQPDVPLPSQMGDSATTVAPRYVRLLWQDPASAPRLSAAQSLAEPAPGPATEVLTSLSPSFSPEPASPEPTRKGTLPQPVAGALHVDLGGPLPLVSMDLDPGPGSQVLPLRVQGRLTLNEPWRDLTQGVVYRLQRGSGADARRDASPPLALGATARYLRLLPDERAAPLDPARARLTVQARLARLVFAGQGQPPYQLLAGADDRRAGALPLTTLVPALDDERPRFGQAQLGDWAEVASVAAQAADQARRAALRPWLLWAVLLLGVAGLAVMVWRLLRAQQTQA